MLRQALDYGYALSSFERYSADRSKTVILRHDVDYTLNGVPQLVEVENRCGVTATYFFRVHAHEYNLFTPHVYKLIREIRACGHEIGLHFEAMTFARALDLDPRDIIRKEKSVIECIYGEPVISASEHRDVSHTVHGTRNFHDALDPLAFGFRHYALHPRYFNEMKYLSDSNGFWREGDLTVHLGRHPRFQILVHPDWWFEKDLLLKGPYFHGLGNELT
jgi:hypothetical protein